MLKLAKTGNSLLNQGLRSFWSTFDSVKAFIGDQIAGTSTPSSSLSAHNDQAQAHESGSDLVKETGVVPPSAAPTNIDGAQATSGDHAEDDGTEAGGPLWGRFPCCISCVSLFST